LTELGMRACAASAACRDFTRDEIEAVLAEILAGYPTYRTYFAEQPAPLADRARIADAARAAATARPDLDADLLAFFEAALAFELPSAEACELARVAQQVTGALLAKGDEDTLSYRQVRLLARCEVGAELAAFAISPAEAHRRLAAGRRRSLLATATHDTKRGEDVRARLAVLSEMPATWAEAVHRWRARAEAGWSGIQPDRVLEYATWQTLVGSWPISYERVRAWAEKASREARARTAWRRPDTAYEFARDRWLEAVFADRELVDDIAKLAAELAPHGARNSLAQLLVKLTAPGVPDFYQGCELRDDALVDPDNRRPVDFGARTGMLREIAGAAEQLELLESMTAALSHSGDLGAAKLWLMQRVLHLPRDPTAEYEALVATGHHAERVFAFRLGRMITVVPRLGVGAGPAGWRDTRLALPDGTWRDALCERDHAGTVAVDEIWRTFPVALLVRA
jgi:(1->4)-alpha-D-glucan 1-alpha-D-glucosylmutase